jgi:hypothetical protein
MEVFTVSIDATVKIWMWKKTWGKSTKREVGREERIKMERGERRKEIFKKTEREGWEMRIGRIWDSIKWDSMGHSQNLHAKKNVSKSTKGEVGRGKEEEDWEKVQGGGWKRRSGKWESGGGKRVGGKKNAGERGERRIKGEPAWRLQSKSFVMKKKKKKKWAR